MKAGELVKHVRQPLALMLPVDIEAHDGVVDGLGAHDDLIGQRLLSEMLDGTGELEVL